MMTGMMPPVMSWVMPWVMLGEDWDHASSNAWVMLQVTTGFMPWVMPWMTPGEDWDHASSNALGDDWVGEAAR